MQLLETVRLIERLYIMQVKSYRAHGKFGGHECFSMVSVIILILSNQYLTKLSSISLLIFSSLYFKLFSVVSYFRYTDVTST